MSNDLRVLEQANPVPATDASGWVDSAAGNRVMDQVLERTEGDLGELEEHPDRRRAWVVALVAALGVIVLIGIPALLFDSGPDSELAPTSLGVDYVWPQGGVGGGPENVAREFAEEVLGWVEPSITVEPGADPDGPVWVDIEQPGNSVLAVLTVPIGEGRRVLSQIGSSDMWLVVDGLDADAEQWVAFSGYENAVKASLYVRRVGDDRAVVLDVGLQDLRNEGRVLLEGRPQVASALIVYRDDAGDVIGASGGQFGPIDPTATLTPEEILEDGVVTETEYYGASVAALACLEAGGIDAGLAFDSSGFATFSTGGEIDETFGQCHSQHLSGVDEAWRSQNAPPGTRP